MSVEFSPEPELFDDRMEKIHGLLAEWFTADEPVIQFDMGRGFQVFQKGREYTLHHPSFDQIQREHEEGPLDLPAKGPCRRLTPAIAGKLLREGLIEEVQYLIDDVQGSDPRYLHTAFTAMVAGEEVFFDVARRTPFLRGARIDAGTVQSCKRTYSLSRKKDGTIEQIRRDVVEEGGDSHEKTILWRPFVPEEERETMLKTLRLYTRWQVTRTLYENGHWVRKASVFSPIKEQAFEALKKHPELVTLVYGEEA